jgi:GNAT superfamily N-acetyltransferase
MSRIVPSQAHFDWESQACQYPPTGEPGISLISPTLVIGGSTTVVDCLLYRDEDGSLVGIFNHYNAGNPLQAEGSANLWVRPDRQRQGIATALLRRADELWDLFDQASYTPEGNAWIEGLVRQGKIDKARTGSLEDNPASRSAKRVGHPCCRHRGQWPTHLCCLHPEGQ